MNKINKKAAALVALQGFGALSPLVSVSADIISDVKSTADHEGLNVDVKDEVVHVNSKSEADAKNAASDNQLKSDTERLLAKISQYKKAKQDVATHNARVASRDKEIQVESDRVQAIRDANNKIRQENDKLLSAYNERVKDIEGRNTHKKQEFDAANKSENDRVKSANDAALTDYNQKKHDIDTHNKQLITTYEADKKRIDDLNAVEKSRVDALNKKNMDDYKRVHDKWVADTAANDASVDAQQKANAAIKAENDRITQDNQKIDDANRKAREKYQSDLAEVTRKNQQIEADNRKAQQDYDTAVASGSNVPGKTLVSADEYQRKLAEYKQQLREYVKQVEAYNTHSRASVIPQFLNEFSSVFTQSIEATLANKNNMKLTGTSGVTFHKPIETPAGQSLSSSAFNPYRPDMVQSKTPISGTVGNVEAYAVRIPKGQSVTIEYTRKDGQNYVDKDTFTGSTRLVTDAAFNSKDKFDKDSNDFQSVKKFRMTITNNDAITKGKDLIMYVANDMSIPVYYGISPEDDTLGNIRWSQPDEANRFISFTSSLELLNEKDEVLKPVVSQYDTNIESITGSGSIHNEPQVEHFAKGTFESLDQAKKHEFIAVKEKRTNHHGVEFTVTFKDVNDVPDKAANWRDTEIWKSEKYGLKDGKIATMYGYYDKSATDGLNPGGSGSNNFAVTSVAKPRPEKPEFGYAMKPEKPKLKDKLPLPKEPVDTPHKPLKQLNPISSTRLPEPSKPVLVTSTLKELPKYPTLLSEPKKPTLLVPKLIPEPEYEQLPPSPKLKKLQVIVEKPIEKLKPLPEPEKPTLELKHVRYVYDVRTIWESVNGEILKPWLDGTLEKDTFQGFDFVKTTKDANGDTHHIYKPVKIAHVYTIWETESGRTLKPWDEGRHDKQRFDGYEYIRTLSDGDGNVHHVYKPIPSKVTDEPTKPKVEEPKTETPKVETPKQEEPKVETPKVEEPKVEQPKVETPKQDKPKVETPKQEEPKVETPKQEEPKVETPKQEEPKVETPKVETPKQEEPKVETPKQEEPKVETPKQGNPTQQPVSKETGKQLPKTGDSSSFGLVLGGLLSSLGLMGSKKRKKRN